MNTMSDLISEEDIKKEVDKVLNKFINYNLPTIVNDAFTAKTKELAEVPDMMGMIRKVIGEQQATIQTYTNNFLEAGGCKTTIQNTVQKYIKDHGFVPSSLSEVEKNVIVSEVSSKVGENFDVAKKIREDVEVRKEIALIAADMARKARLMSIADELKMLGFAYEAEQVERQIPSIWNIY